MLLIQALVTDSNITIGIGNPLHYTGTGLRRGKQQYRTLVPIHWLANYAFTPFLTTVVIW